MFASKEYNQLSISSCVRIYESFRKILLKGHKDGCPMNYWFGHRPSSWVVKPSCNAFISFYTRSITTGLRKWTILHKWSCLIVPHQIPQYPVSTSKNRYVALFSPPKIAAPSRLSALIAGRSCRKGLPLEYLTNVRLNFRRCALSIFTNKILCVH